MAEIRLFDAHNHLQDHPGRAEAALDRARAVGVKGMLCNGTGPGDWAGVEALAAAHKEVVPCFGLHPWLIDAAPPDWMALLEDFLTRTPSCVGEIGLDKVKGADLKEQEEAFRAQLRLAKKLNRPVSIHCVRAWGRLLDILKEERPPSFMLHAYGGPAEMTGELSGLGAYFSFGGELLDPKRRKMRSALRNAPEGRILFETESPGPQEWRSGPHGMIEVLAAAAGVLGRSRAEPGRLSWNNAREFLGDIFTGGEGGV